MDIRPSMPIAGIAGTARAQVHGSDKDRGPAAGGVAESQRIGDNDGLNEGTRTEDRDADGRQLLDHQPGGQSHDGADHDAGTEPKKKQAVSSGHEGLKLDIEA